MQTETIGLKVFPNPAFGSVVNANRFGNYSVYSSEGELLETFENTAVIYIGSLKKGSYFIKDEEGQIASFMRN